MFALLHHLHIFSLGKVLPDQPPVLTAIDIPEMSRAKKAGVCLPGLKPNAEINLGDSNLQVHLCLLTSYALLSLFMLFVF